MCSYILFPLIAQTTLLIAAVSLSRTSHWCQIQCNRHASSIHVAHQSPCIEYCTHYSIHEQEGSLVLFILNCLHFFYFQGSAGKTVVVVGTVTDDARVFTIPKLTVCLLFLRALDHLSKFSLTVFV
jgi:hypothetical protein